MATLSPATPRNVHDQSSTAPIEVNNPEDAFRELWSQALQKFEKSVAWNPSQWQSMVRRMGQCREAEDVCRILDGTMRSFESFRGSETTWGKLRNKYLKPAIEVLLLFNDAIAETAAFFPEVPGGKAIFAAFGVVLQTTKGVSAYCDALVVLFEELNLFLEALRPRLLAPSSLGPASKTIAIAILSHLLDVVVHVAKILSKGSWLGRLSLYGRVLVKDTTVQDALRRIRALTDLEVRAIVSEIRVDTSDIRTAASDMRDITRQTQKDVAHMQSTGIQTKEITTRLLSEFRALQQDQVKARGIIGRGMDRLIRGQKELIALLRAEREQRNKVDASRVFEKLARVERADIDAQNPEGCMKDTRVKILKDLRAWSQDNNAPRLYWLNGMAGTGKSAIARSFCHQLRRDRLLGGSFFCSRGGSVEEGDVQHIIPTLAASLATHSLSFNENLLAGLTEEPFSVHWNLALQIERLLQTPMSSYDGEADMLVLVIDALDECSDDESTRHLLSRLVRVSSVLPVKFFITSRPEPHIRSELESLDPSLGHVLRLHDIEQDIVRADISLYLVHGLRAMRGPTFPPKWPNKSDVTTLVRLSGKLFIYAFTALQYVRKDPLGRLPKLTGTKVTAGRPLTQPLDDIYSLILSEAMNPNEFEAEEIDLTRRIMAMIVAVREPLTIASLGRLLGLPPYRMRVSLTRLYAVIYVPLRDDSGVLSTFHASFNDFLTTASRAPADMLPYMSDSHAICATACIETLQSDQLRFGVCQAPTACLSNTEQQLAHIDDALRYACLYWAYHIERAPVAEKRGLVRMTRNVFMGPKFLFWLEVLSTIGAIDKAIDMFESVKTTITMEYVTRNSVQYVAFIDAAIDFIKQFYPALERSAPHIYLSALWLCHADSIIAQKCQDLYARYSQHDADPRDLRNRGGSLRASATYSSNDRGIIIGAEGVIRVFRLSGPRSYSRGIVTPSKTVLNGMRTSFSQDGTRFVHVSDDGSIRSYSLSDGGSAVKSLSRFKDTFRDTYRSNDTAMTLSYDGKYLAAGRQMDEIHVWDTKTGYITWGLRSSYNDETADVFVRSIAFSRIGSLIACGSSSGKITIWDLVTGAFVRVTEPHTGCVNSVYFGPWDIQAVSGSTDCTICLWQVGDGKIITRFVAHKAPVTSVALSKMESCIVSGSLDRTIRIWSIDSVSGKEGPVTVCQLLYRFDVLQPIQSAVFSSDERSVLCTTMHGSVQVWYLDTDDCLVTAHYLDEDGWLRGPNGELLLWLDANPEHGKFLIHPECTSVLHGDRLDMGWIWSRARDWRHPNGVGDS